MSLKKARKATSFYFRCEIEFLDKMQKAVNEGSVESISDAIRKFSEMGLDIAKVSAQDRMFIQKITKEIKKQENNYNDKTLRQIIEKVMSADQKWKSLSKLTDYEMYQLTQAVMNELLARPCAKNMARQIMSFDKNFNDNNSSSESNLKKQHYEYMREKNEHFNDYNFESLDTLIEDNLVKE